MQPSQLIVPFILVGLVMIFIIIVAVDFVRNFVTYALWSNLENVRDEQRKLKTCFWLHWLPWQSLLRVSPSVHYGFIAHIGNSSIQTTRAWRRTPYVRYSIPGDHLPIHMQRAKQNEQKPQKFLLQKIDDGDARLSITVANDRNSGNYTDWALSYHFIGVFAYNYGSIQIKNCTVYQGQRLSLLATLHPSNNTNSTIRTFLDMLTSWLVSMTESSTAVVCFGCLWRFCSPE